MLRMGFDARGRGFERWANVAKEDVQPGSGDVRRVPGGKDAASEVAGLQHLGGWREEIEGRFASADRHSILNPNWF
jgi:hypothetical protein